jgi:hypothetical protein
MRIKTTIVYNIKTHARIALFDVTGVGDADNGLGTILADSENIEHAEDHATTCITQIVWEGHLVAGDTLVVKHTEDDSKASSATLQTGADVSYWTAHLLSQD